MQNWTRDLLLSLHPHLTTDDIRSVAMGQNGEDIQLSPAARVSIPLSIECGNQERVNVWAKHEQCEKNAPPETVPVTVLKKNGKRPIVVVDAEIFFRSVAEIQKTPVL